MEVLDLKFFSQDLNRQVSVKFYLKKLLSTLWAEGESFRGKSPLGNSGWQYDVYAALIKAGMVEGKIDNDGYVEGVDVAEADKLIMNAIRKL